MPEFNLLSSIFESGLFQHFEIFTTSFAGLPENALYLISNFQTIQKMIFEKKLFQINLTNATSVVVTWICSLLVVFLAIIILRLIKLLNSQAFNTNFAKNLVSIVCRKKTKHYRMR